MSTSETNVVASTDSKYDDPLNDCIAILNAVYEEYKDERPILAEVIHEARSKARLAQRRAKYLP